MLMHQKNQRRGIIKKNLTIFSIIGQTEPRRDWMKTRRQKNAQRFVKIHFH
jgi:hypothetical protein